MTCNENNMIITTIIIIKLTDVLTYTYASYHNAIVINLKLFSYLEKPTLASFLWRLLEEEKQQETHWTVERRGTKISRQVRSHVTAAD